MLNSQSSASDQKEDPEAHKKHSSIWYKFWGKPPPPCFLFTLSSWLPLIVPDGIVQIHFLFASIII